MLYGFQLSPRKVSPHLSNHEFFVASFSAPGRFHLRLPCMDLGGLRRQGKFKKPCYENWKDPEMQTVGGGFKKIQKRVWNGKIKKQLKSTNKKQLKSWPQCQPLKCQEKWPMSLMSIPKRIDVLWKGWKDFRNWRSFQKLVFSLKMGLRPCQVHHEHKKDHSTESKYWLLQGFWRVWWSSELAATLKQA